MSDSVVPKRGGRNIIINGRPTQQPVYNPELAEDILTRMAQGEALAAICRTPNYPSWMAVHKWRRTVEGFGVRFAQAREIQAEALCDEILELRDNRDIDPQERRVQFDMTKWVMSKIAPLAYGDKLTVAGDPNAPIHHVHSISEAIDSLSEPELEALERFTRARIAALEAQAVDVTPAPEQEALAPRNRRKK